MDYFFLLLLFSYKNHKKRQNHADVQEGSKPLMSVQGVKIGKNWDIKMTLTSRFSLTKRL